MRRTDSAYALALLLYEIAEIGEQPMPGRSPIFCALSRHPEAWCGTIARIHRTLARVC
jgi:hypothetical protein